MWVIPIAAFTTAYYFTTEIMPVIKRVWKILPEKRVKPFDCAVCLSVWLSVVMWFLPIGVAQFFAVLFTSGFLAIKIK